MNITPENMNKASSILRQRMSHPGNSEIYLNEGMGIYADTVLRELLDILQWSQTRKVVMRKWEPAPFNSWTYCEMETANDNEVPFEEWVSRLRELGYEKYSDTHGSVDLTNDDSTGNGGN